MKYSKQNKLYELKKVVKTATFNFQNWFANKNYILISMIKRKTSNNFCNNILFAIAPSISDTEVMVRRKTEQESIIVRFYIIFILNERVVRNALAPHRIFYIEISIPKQIM